MSATRKPSIVRRLKTVLYQLDANDQEFANIVRRCGMQLRVNPDGSIIMQPLDTVVVAESDSGSADLIEGAFRDGEA